MKLEGTDPLRSKGQDKSFLNLGLRRFLCDSYTCWQKLASCLPLKKFCYGWLHRRLLRRYRPQSAVNCSTLWERAAGSPPNTSQVSLIIYSQQLCINSHISQCLAWDSKRASKSAICTRKQKSSRPAKKTTSNNKVANKLEGKTKKPGNK